MSFSFLSSLPSFISWDFLVLLIIIFVFGVLGFLWRKRKILALILSFYLAAACVNFLPQQHFLASFQNHYLTSSLLYFLGLVLFFLFILMMSGISLRTASSSKVSARKQKRANSLKGFIYGLIGGGMFISLSLSLTPLSLQRGLSPLTFYIFLSTIAKISWLFIPLLSMMIIK